jgi:TATA-binding protein-associated factor Taf7
MLTQLSPLRWQRPGEDMQGEEEQQEQQEQQEQEQQEQQEQQERNRFHLRSSSDECREINSAMHSLHTRARIVSALFARLTETQGPFVPC